MVKFRSKLKLPREHGAWAMLYVPFALGVGVAGQLKLPVLFLLIGTTGVFISRESLLACWRARVRGRTDSQALRVLLVYLAIALIAGLALILVYQLYWLLPLSAFGALLLVLNAKHATVREDRSIVSESLAIVGLTMTAPAGHYAASGRLDVTSLTLWVLSVAYFASSVFYIKLRVTTLHAKKEANRQRVRWQCISYHGFLLLSLLAWVFTASIPLLVLIAFAPVLARTVWSLVRPPKRLSLTRVGLSELAYSIMFLVFIVLTFRMHITQ